MSTDSFLQIDYLIIIAYIIGIFILAFKSGKLSTESTNETIIEDQYLAGRSVTFIESICSIIATEVSALTFLGIPAFAFEADYNFIHVYFGAIVARLVIAFVILPRVYNKGLTLYGIMADAGGTKGGQRLTSIFYSFTKILSIGVRLFSGSIIISTFFNLNIYTAIFIICFITFFYTLIGGLKAVVRTDIIQMSLFVLGGIFAHFLIPDISNTSWFELMSTAVEAGKTEFFSFSNPWPFIIGFVGGMLFDTATHGVDQDFLQRLMANKSLKGAQLAISLSSLLSISIGFLFLSVGSLLWSHYQQNPLPVGVTPDQLFAHFITKYFPAGIRGIMVAGVLAATMSTLDSTINALSSCLYNDIIPHRDANKVGFYYKIDTLLITGLLMLVSFVASTSSGLLLLGLKIQSWTAGALLSLFVGTLLIKKIKLTPPIVIGSYIAGLSGVFINTNFLNWSWHFNTYIGLAFALIWSVLFTLIIKLRGLD